jgi:hypothetical protein
MTLTIVATHDFDIAVPQSSFTLEQNAIISVDITVTRKPGFSDPIDFTASGVPPGAYTKFDPPPPSVGSSQRLLFTTQSTAQLGTYTITVVATALPGGTTRTGTFPVTITAGAQYCPSAPIADAYVSPPVTDGSPGVSEVLRVESDGLQQAAKPYLAFDVRGIALPFDKVELVMALSANPGAVAAHSSRTVEVLGITDNNDWNPSTLAETAIDWNSAPKNDITRAIGFVGEGSSSANAARSLGTIVVSYADVSRQLYRVDVTDYVRWALAGNSSYSDFAASDADSVLTFMMATNILYYAGGVSDYAEFLSRETSAECERPHLEVYR